MVSEYLNLLLADDDKDDCLFFTEALEELHASANLTTVHDGEQLMMMLTKKNADLPNLLFLDLNMPRKNGFECLAEIKLNKKLNGLRVIIFSTSSEQKTINLLYENGAQYYIRKPADFGDLKIVIEQALIQASQKTMSQPAKEDFIISGRLKLTAV